MTNKGTSMTKRELCDHPECWGLFLFISVRCYWSSLIESNSGYCCETWMYFVTCRIVIDLQWKPLLAKASITSKSEWYMSDPLFNRSWAALKPKVVSLQAQWRVIIEIPPTFRADFCLCNDFSCPGDICYHILTQMSRKTKKLCACVRVIGSEWRYTMITTYYCADGACFRCLKMYSLCENNQWLQ